MFVLALGSLLFYLTRGKFARQALCLAGVILLYMLIYWLTYGKTAYTLIQLCALLTIPLLYTYNGQRGKWKGMKWLFYVYYPAHLILIGFLREALIRGYIPYP